MNKFIIMLMGGLLMVATGCDVKAAQTKANQANSNPELLAISMIAKYEGFSDKVYTCPGGHKTIGYGFTDADLVKKGTITRAEADKVLGKKVRAELAFLREHVKGLTPKQEAACVSWIYNLGRGNFLNSTFLKKLKARDFKAAQIECNKWVYAKGTKLNGLVKRRAAEAKWLS